MCFRELLLWYFAAYLSFCLFTICCLAVFICLGFYTNFNTSVVISRQLVCLIIIPGQLTSNHKFLCKWSIINPRWFHRIIGERQMTIRLSVRDHLSQRDNASPENRTRDPDALPIKLPGRIKWQSSKILITIHLFLIDLRIVLHTDILISYSGDGILCCDVVY